MSLPSKVPLPLVPSAIEPGGVLELLEKDSSEPSGFRRVAFLNDVSTGVELTCNLSSLDELRFRIAWDRFRPGSPAKTLKELQQSQPYGENEEMFDKMSLVDTVSHFKYTELSGRERWFRVQTLQDSLEGEAEGVGVDAAVELADYLTQYKPGRSQFTGQLPSQIAKDVLSGRQSIEIKNRRFVTDLSPSMEIATEVPNQSPLIYSAAGGGWQPIGANPMMVELEPTIESQVSAFSGLPTETVPPNGAFMDLQTGGFGAISWDDLYPATNTYAFSSPYYEPSGKRQTGTLQLLPQGTSYDGPREGYSAVYYGAMKAWSTGTYRLRVSYRSGIRVYFRDRLIANNLQYTDATMKNVDWVTELEAGKWYPFVFHLLGRYSATSSQRPYISFEYGIDLTSLGFGWTYSVIPAENLTHQHNGGFFLVKIVDVSGAQRFMWAYKDSTGKRIRLAWPLNQTIYPATIESLGGNYDNYYNWPQMIPQGALVEEVSFPADTATFPNSYVLDWGSGWTRRPSISTYQRGSSPTSSMDRAIGWSD